MLKLPYFVSTLFILLIVSCGSGSQGSQDLNRPLVDNQEITAAVYQAQLSSLNPQFGDSSGRAVFELNEDVISVEVVMNEVHYTAHLQVLHSGSACPSLAADTNLDGVVDSEEAQSVSGNPLFALDGDLNSRSAGRGYRPVGNYFYTETASWERLLQDLWKGELLPQDSRLSLRGRAVLIYGVSTLSSVPSSVTQIDSYSRHDSVPIACGTLELIR